MFSRLVLSYLILSDVVLCGLMLSYVLLYPIVSPRLVFSCPGLSRLVFLLSFTTKEITVSWPSGKEITTQKEQQIPQKRSQKQILNQFWGLGPFWGHRGISKAQAYIPSLIFYRFCVPMGTPLGTPKITLGATKRPRKPPKVCF